MTFPMWLKSRENLSPFESWLVVQSKKYKLRRYRDFCNFIWHYAYRDSKGKVKPFAEIATRTVAQLFDQYELRRR